MYLAGLSAKAPGRMRRSRAACHGINPGLFPAGSTGPALEHIADAKAIRYACQLSGRSITSLP